MAEHEIVRLYDYTEKIEKILEDVEKGRFQVQRLQGAKGGKSTTGVANFSATPGGTGSETMGAVVLPPGLKPTNPLKLFEGSGNNDLQLTKRIVEKHKERVARIDRMKATEFRKSLFLASKPGATAAGAIDETLKQQVRELLDVKSNKSRAKPSIDAAPNTARGLHILIAFCNFFLCFSSPIDALPEVVKAPSGRPTTAAAYSNRVVGFIAEQSSAGVDSKNQTAPGALQNKLSTSEFFGNESSNDKPSYVVNFDVMAELEELRARVAEEEITAQRVLDELASNETLQYIQKLEAENERLKKEVLAFSNQLQASKVPVSLYKFINFWILT